MDSKTKVKSDVLQKIIDMMDDSMLGDLKSKSPKFMKIETNDPSAAKDVVKSLGKEIPEEDSEESDLSDLLGKDPKEESKESPEEKDSEDEDLQRLLEMYKQLK